MHIIMIMVLLVVIASWLTAAWLYRDSHSPEQPRPIMTPGQWRDFVAYNDNNIEQFESYYAGGCVIERHMR